MGTSVKESKLYSFFKAVITVFGFAVCFYLMILGMTGSYRLICDIGNKRVLFLNPVYILIAAVAAVLTAGVLAARSSRVKAYLSGFEDEQHFNRTVTVLKAVIFVECVLFAVMAFGMNQRLDQYSVQYSAYGLSWNVAETLTPPRHLGVYPNNTGIVLILYLLSFVTGHYNNAAYLLIMAMFVPFIYYDLAEIGGRFGLSRKSRIMILVTGLLFFPLQAKVTMVYGDIPGLFFAVRAMKHAAEIASGKCKTKNIAVVIGFASAAYVFKNNYIIFAIAIVLYLMFEFLRQRRFKELLIPLAVLVMPVLSGYCIKLITGAVIGGQVSSGASKLSWIAMGMQENAGMFNGFNDVTYAESGFDTAVQSEVAKTEITARLMSFLADPNQAIGFYVRKVMAQWTDPTYSAFDFICRNVYLYGNASPLLWAVTNPKVIRALSSFLKLFQIMMLTGTGVCSIKEARRKTGSPALLLIVTFIGGFFFHMIWEVAPTYAMPYSVIIIPTGVSGIISVIKKLSTLKKKELSNIRIQISASGIVFFAAGTLVFLLAAAGIGTIRQILADGREEYKMYFNETLQRARDPVEEGTYYLKPALEGYEGDGLEVMLIRYAGKYRMRMIIDGSEDEIYLTNVRGKIKADWNSSNETQVFVIFRNIDGTYSICQDVSGAVAMDPESGMVIGEFVDYTNQFGSQKYDEFVAGHPEMTWNLVPAS